ncbi:MAG: amidohydrolase [Cyanobacteria bacterium P01_D01_bin.123]
MTDFIRNVLVPAPGDRFAYLTPSEPPSYERVDITIEGEIISALSPAGFANNQTANEIDGSGKLLLPGWVNAHTHSPEMWVRGLIPPLPLELWLAELYSYPLQGPQQTYVSALLTAVETLLSGGTTVVDHLVLLPGRELEAIDAAVRAYREAGIRAYVAPLIQDEPFEWSVPEGQTLPVQVPPPKTKDVLALMQQAIAAYHRPQEGIEIALAPTGIQMCSDDLFAGCLELSQQHGLCRHSHLLETPAQEQLAREKYGMTAVAHLHELGFLGPEASFAHCVWLNDRDIELMAATGATVVHNPLSNLRLGSGIAPVLKYLERGVNVSFGCDGAASNDGQSLFEVLKIGSMLHNITDRDYRHWVSPQWVAHLASVGGAKGLNASHFGRLAVGQQADLVLYDLDVLSLLPHTDPLGQLIWGRAEGAVDRVWVRGQSVVVSGQPVNVAITDLKSQIAAFDGWLNHRQSGMRERLEPHYRRVMGLPA